MKPETTFNKSKGFCNKCNCKPCRCVELEAARNHGSTHCESCGCRLIMRGGYSGTGLCGPCCTGDSDTIDEI